MKKILVPIDFSLPSRWAADVACDVAKRSGAEIVLLNVVEQSTQQSFSVQGHVSDLEGWEEKLFTLKLIEKNKEELNSWTNDFHCTEVKVTQMLRIGNPFHGIHTVITDQAVDLVVMGTLGHSFLENIFLGSTTDKVVRYSKCPVLTVHEKPSSKVYENIVYATSMSEDENAFARVLCTAQELYGATVHFVKINTPSSFTPDNQTKKLLMDFASKLGFSKYTVNVFNDLTAEEGIIHFADSIGADLIGMATHGRSAFAQVLGRSIAEDVVNHSKQPVLTYVTK